MKKRKLIVRLHEFLEDLQDIKSAVREFHLSYTRPFARILYALLGVVSIGTLTLHFGFYYPHEWDRTVYTINSFLIYYMIVYEIFGFLFTNTRPREYIRMHKPELIIVILVILQKLFEKDIINYLKLGNIGTDETALIFLSINQVFLIVSNLTRFIRSTRIYNIKKVNPSLVFFISFASIIILGTLILNLPKAKKEEIRLIDIIFTVISATCVTGLSTLNIYTAFTRFGLLIILALIQIGGLGLITLTTFFSIFLAGKASVNDQMLMKDLLSEEAIGKVGNIIKQIALQTFFIEGIGAVLLYYSFPEDSGITGNEKIFFAVFHSISAFCNAGFSLFANGLAESFFKDTYLFLSTIMGLIIFGGLGFPVIMQIWNKIKEPDSNSSKFNISTKLVLIMSAALLLIGTVFYYFLESPYTLQDKSIGDRIFHSFFYSVTTRTAGFNTLDIAKMGMPMVFFSFLLMWIGASPNSTGGGIKTSTFAVSFLNIIDLVKGKDRMEIFNRTISPSSIGRASATIVLSLFIIFTAIFTMIVVEDIPFVDLCFEAVSAFGTVGLSRGITASLSDISKIVICIVMFLGRVGVLTVIIAFSPKTKALNYRYPIEYVVVG